MDDLEANAYEKLLEDGCKRLQAWRGHCKLSTFLVQVVRNACVDYARKNSNNREIAAEDPTVWHCVVAPPDTLHQEERLTALKKGIEALSAKQSLIMQLRLQGKTVREIARLMNIPSGTASVENSRAMERLREIMTTQGGIAPDSRPLRRMEQ